jgi:hypothetical protein
MSFVAYCYGAEYEETAFSKSLASVGKPAVAPPATPVEPEVDFETLLNENFPVREKLTAKRIHQLKKRLHRQADGFHRRPDPQGIH